MPANLARTLLTRNVFRSLPVNFVFRAARMSSSLPTPQPPTSSTAAAAAAAAANTTATTSSTTTTTSTSDPLVMHVVVRLDLVTKLGWSVGSVITQCCHASVAAMVKYAADPSVKDYVGDLDHMHKVALEVPVCVCLSLSVSVSVSVFASVSVSVSVFFSF